MPKPKITHIQTSTKNLIGGLIPTACGLFVPREQLSTEPFVSEMRPVSQLAPPEERRGRAKGRIRPPGSPRSDERGQGDPKVCLNPSAASQGL